MKTVYTDVMKRLQSEVPALNGIELNVGQLKRIEKGEALPITYPCALVGISIPECADITEKIQECKAVISATLVFDPFVIGETSSNAPETNRENALIPYDIISDVYKTLQGFETKNFNALSRIAQGVEEHEKLFVYKIDFNCEFEDITAESI
ncbi:hypothetical protein [Prevotella sp. 10(H)]|uniref:hypothetical protein n=1 Tax=Prevotella sp. 10(H) TaxID=1158294 RepID=UPI0004A6D5D8|nr:hypothetical protein [Prevotella sp. 10(H)]